MPDLFAKKSPPLFEKIFYHLNKKISKALLPAPNMNALAPAFPGGEGKVAGKLLRLNKTFLLSE